MMLPKIYHPQKQTDLVTLLRNLTNGSYNNGEFESALKQLADILPFVKIQESGDLELIKKLAKDFSIHLKKTNEYTRDSIFIIQSLIRCYYKNNVINDNQQLIKRIYKKLKECTETTYSIRRGNESH